MIKIQTKKSQNVSDKGLMENISCKKYNDLSSPKATVLLKIVEKFYSEELNHYKNVIYKRGLETAVQEIAYKTKRTISFVDKAISNRNYDFNIGNPLGINGKRVNFITDEIVPVLIELSQFKDRVEELKKMEGIVPNDLNTLNNLFTEETFITMNNMIVVIAERHNEQLKNTDIKTDPFTNEVIDLDNPNTVRRNGVYYRSDSVYKMAQNFHKVDTILDRVLNKKTIPGFRWLLHNIKIFNSYNK